MAAEITFQLMQMMLALVQALFANKAALAMENLALRQQLSVYKRKQPRPLLTDLDRTFWAALKDQFAGWVDALVIVKPETVVRWQKRRFQDFWTRKSKPGRPSIPRRHIGFIRRISSDHPELAAPNPADSKLVARPVLNGLHHDYRCYATSCVM